MEYPIYTVLGILVIIYLFFLMLNRNKSKKFMEDYRREDRKEKEN